MNTRPARSSPAFAFFRTKRHHTYLYVSYHKCATLFTARVVRAVCAAQGLRTATFDSRHRKVGRLALRSNDFLLLTDYSSSMLDLNTVDGRGFHVIRDPRDILVSMYFSHRDSHRVNHAEIRRNRRKLAKLDLLGGLTYLMEESRFFQRIMRELAAWDYDTERFYETSFERLTTDPEKEFEAIFTFLGILVEQSDLNTIIQQNSFETLKADWRARNPGTDINHYRSGVAGDWKNHLAGEPKTVFRQRYGDLLIKLGYEKSMNW
ncbi:MAG: hypothetical protein HKM89_07915 [Gemmatimonadales bacterium]|nr:hypothetical protein [Gemmatimonadales bacterium]